jgi:acyl-[acyl-carrier-protein]-phospholipid O-acyltransferase/long-chain-fatty-acid--[acyl-carrier-protein] ligase
MIAVKLFEILSMTLGFFAISSGNLYFMLLIPFLMGLHSTFFSPAKYGILPEILPEKELSRANGILEMTTFVAIVTGTSLGGILYDHWKGEPGRLNLVLIAVAIAGTLFSLGVPKVAPSGAHPGFRWNPLGEIGQGLKELRQSSNLWQTALGITYFWLLGAFLMAAIAPLGKEVMHLSDSETSMLETFLAIGIGVGSLLAGKLSGDKVELGLVPIGSIGMGVGALLLALRHQTYAQAAEALVFLGFFGGFFAVPLNALLQQKAERGEKGRILATNNFMNALGMILAFGMLSLFGGVLHLPVDKSILILGIMTFGVTIYLLTILPDFLIRFSLYLFTHSIYRIRMIGQENVPFRGPALLVCNHVSLVDGLLIGSSLQRFVRFMVWKPYYEHPAFHWLFKLMSAIPVGSGKKEVAECLDKAREELKAGHVVCIFAEGAISRTGNMLPFKRGFERIMEGVDVPIVPVHLDRLWGSIFSFKEGKFVTKWPKEVPFPVTVSFGKPLPAASKAEEVREVVQELSADAAEHRKKAADILPYRFLKTAKRNWFSFCMAGSDGKELSFGKTLIAGLLLQNWVKEYCPEEKVGLLLPSSVGGSLANLGVSLAGKVPVNLNFTSGKDAMGHAIKECGLKTILTSKIFLHKAGLEERPGMVHLEDVMREFTSLSKVLVMVEAFLVPSFILRFTLGLHRVKPDDLATVIFSSGSTGTPKGVMLSHFNVLSNLESCEQIFWVSKEDRILGVLPFFHSFGFMGTLWFPLVAGFGVAYHPNPIDAKAIGELVQRFKVTIMISTPTFYSTYARKVPKEQFASVRFAVVGAEKLRESIAKEFKEKYDLDLMEGYGATEMSPVVAVNVPDYLEGHSKQRGMKPGTVGHPVPGVAVKVVDPATGLLLPSNQEGLLLVKGPNRMVGYLNQPEKTAEVLENGWYKTGDIALVDEDGFIKITDRLSRFSKIGGEMVPHIKVEDVILGFLGEYTCAVTSLPDEQKGEKLVVLYTHPTMKPEELWGKLSQTDLPKLWVPKKDNFYFVETLPSLGSGKLDLKGVKQRATELTNPLSHPEKEV